MMRLIEDREVVHLARDRCFQVATARVDRFLLRNTRTRPDGVLVRAEEAIVVADHSKFGRTTFAKIASLKDISMIISDRDCPAE